MKLGPFKSETLSSFAMDDIGMPAMRAVLWKAKKNKASLAISACEEEYIHGNDLELSEDFVITTEDSFAAQKEPYGNVQYADPGYQKDKKKRYPIDTPEHIRAAWNYINKAKNGGEYSSSQLSKIKSRIISAWKSKIDPKGPPSAQS